MKHSSSLDAYIARNEAGVRYMRLQMAFSGTISLALLVVAIITESQAVGLALAIPLVFFGYSFERWQDAKGGRESLRHDVLALSNVLYQDATIINQVLDDAMIHKYLQNLLQAALNDEEFGLGYWQQGVRPFLEHGEAGFREDWRYQVDLALLQEPVCVPLPDSGSFQIEPRDFWRLGTEANYRQQVKHPAEEYYIGCTFSLEDLPTWFRDEGFLLRELTQISPEHKEALACVFSDEWIDLSDPEAHEARAAADALFGSELWIAGKELEPVSLQISEFGVRRRYPVTDELRKAMLDPVSIRISVRTFQPRKQTFFPVNIALPTRHPTVHFTYGQTPLTASEVNANVFFSAEEPYRPELVEHNEEAKRIELQTNRNDWVFAGSGCIFVWSDGDAAVEA